MFGLINHISYNPLLVYLCVSMCDACACVRAFMHVCASGCVRACVCVCAFVRACVRACVYACVCLWLCACVCLYECSEYILAAYRCPFR